MSTLLDDIRALPQELLATQDTFSIAAALSVGRVKLVPTEVGTGTILEALGLIDGNALLDVVQSTPDFRHVWNLINQGRLRVDSNLVRGTIDNLVTVGVLTAANGAALKALGEQPDPVDEMDVRRVCWSANGVWQV